MLLKTYRGPDLETALASARAEMGPDALVLGTTEKKSRLGMPVVEVTVTTPDGRAVPDIPVSATISYNDTDAQIELGRTDATGKVQVSLDQVNPPPGEQVQIIISAFNPNGRLLDSAILTFRTRPPST